MLLNARMLNNVTSVNTFDYVDQVQFTEGDTVTIYFQLIDANLDLPNKGFVPSGRRYVPAFGATLSCVLTNINDTKKITRAAVQPFPSSDGSIWAISVLATDKVRGTVDLSLTLSESTKLTYGRKRAAVAVAPQGTL